MFRIKTNTMNLIIYIFKAQYISHLTNAGMACKSVWVHAGQGQEYYLHTYRHKLEGKNTNYVFNPFRSYIGPRPTV
jgi:hypothetical protein